jgi:hypothetical protein
MLPGMSHVRIYRHGSVSLSAMWPENTIPRLHIL